ncbi:B12-binding domain-containing radical SAM protein [Thermodesulfobacteriota bacterium]
MLTTALISFLTGSISTRMLAAHVKKNGFDAICVFFPEDSNSANLAALIELLKEKNVGLVGVSLVTDNYRAAVALTRAIKEKLKVPVVWGGAHVNVRPDECLQHADMVCLGEGEDAFLELVQSCSEGTLDLSIRNIWFNSENGIVRNDLRGLEESLDAYPFSDLDPATQFVISAGGVEQLAEKHIQGDYGIMTSRGCPYSCHYCYNSYRRKQYKGKGRYLRARSIENVIEELVLAKKTFPNLSRINFWDDSFVARKLDDFKIFKKLYREKIGLPFFALIEPMAFDFEKIKMLREAGLAALQVGIQTGSERVNREVYNRNISNRKVIEVTKQIRELGIDVTYDVIFNNPYETEQDVAETVKLFLQFPQPAFLQGFNLIFYPGTEITDRALRDGFVSAKGAAEDFSTIEGRQNTPSAISGGKAEISGRFYRFNYTTDGKEYWNTVLSLFALLHVPRALLLFFGCSKSSAKELLLRGFVRTYALAHVIKSMVMPHE